ncbi:MAG: hypothetical protein V3V60_15825 [Sphingomonas aquatilis]|uniref:hypothetical protein n=1 Tax=Sphingomonas aquatilis TaxID=93063 RepID=UPI002F30C3DC
MIAAAISPERGYRVLYRPGSHCPCCAGAAWHVGRQSAECAICGTPLPLAPADPEPAEPRFAA